MDYNVSFPGLGLEFTVNPVAFTIGNYPVYWYGIIIASGLLLAVLYAYVSSKRYNVDGNKLINCILVGIITGIIGARLYYCFFEWDYYGKNPIEILYINNGGLAIYGGVIAGVITTIIFGKVRKQNFFQLLDTACVGLITGQLIGRWGNFCNREAFGGYTNGLFAMQLKESDVASSNLTHAVLKHIVEIDGTRYIQVHPTFLYESLWNVGVLVVLLLFTKHRKYNGQIFLIYLLGYGLGRVWIEGLRTDQLIFFGTGVAVSQVLSGVLVVASAGILIYQYVKGRQEKKTA